MVVDLDPVMGVSFRLCAKDFIEIRKCLVHTSGGIIERSRSSDTR